MAAFLALRSVRRKQKQCRQENPLQRPENELIYEYRLNKAAIMEPLRSVKRGFKTNAM